MVFAGDKWGTLPVKDLYNTLMMALSIQAAKDMYDRGLKLIDDFYNKYGDFTSPILKDMESYNNIIEGVSNAINDIYARGGDPLRNAQDRAEVARLIRAVPVGDINKLKESAKNAMKYQDAVLKLQLLGLYNPQTAALEVKPLDQYSTLGSNGQIGDGIFNTPSPTPYHNMAQFSKDYFDNIKPFERSAIKNGIRYTKSEISEQDLHNIADAHFNDLVNTPQGQLMYKLLMQQNNNDPKAARDAFNNMVVSGNRDRLYYSDNFDDREYKQRSLALQAERNYLSRQRLNPLNTKINQNDDGISLFKEWYNKGVQNIWNKTGIIRDVKDIPNLYSDFGRDVDKIFEDFGKSHKTKLITYDLLKDNASYELKKKIYAALDGKASPAVIKELNKLVGQKSNAKQLMYAIWKDYENAFSIDMDPAAVADIIGSPVDGNKNVAQGSEANVDNIYSYEDIITNTSGYTKTHMGQGKTKKIRDYIVKYGGSHTTISPTGKGYASLRKIGGKMSVMPKVRVRVTDDDGNVVLDEYAYYNLNINSFGNKGGAYLRKLQPQQKDIFTSSNSVQPELDLGSLYVDENGNVHQMADKSFVTNNYIDLTPQINPGRDFMMYPDYNNWTGYGTWDTEQTSKRLKGKQSRSLATYAPEQGDDLEELY